VLYLRQDGFQSVVELLKASSIRLHNHQYFWQIASVGFQYGAITVLTGTNIKTLG